MQYRGLLKDFIVKKKLTVGDLKGLKFRAYNSATIRIAELTGMAPTKIEAAEISQAFSTGAVESMITSPTTGKNKKIWEKMALNIFMILQLGFQKIW